MMARSRNIKPGFFKSEQVADCSDGARLLFIGLWTLADFRGVMEWRPKRVLAELFPYEKRNMEKLVGELESANLVLRMQKDDKSYLLVCGFHKHQNPHKKESGRGSDLPDPCEFRLQPGSDPVRDGSGTIPSGLIPDSLNPDPDPLILIPDSTTLCTTPQDGDEPEQSEFWMNSNDKPIRFPIKDTGKGTAWFCPTPKLEQWKQTFGDALNVEADIMHARQWLLDNPTKQKTHQGMSRYLGNWLTKNNNSGRGAPKPKQVGVAPSNIKGGQGTGFERM